MCRCVEDCFSFIFKVLIWLCSICIFLIGIALLIVTLVTYYDDAYFNVINLLNQAIEQEYNNSTGYYWLYAVAWAYSGVLIVSSFFGCAATCHERLLKPCTACFILFMLAMIGGSAVYIGVDFGETQHLNQTVYDALSNYTLNSDAQYVDGFEKYT